VVVLMLIGAHQLAAQSDRLPADFDSRASEAWYANLASDATDAFSARIATLAGLRFQAAGDRRTPDLDSALTRAVMAGGRLRESPWGWLALADRLARHNECIPLDQVMVTHWSRCHRAVTAYREALKRRRAFAPAVVGLFQLVPWPELFAEPIDELVLLEGALAKLRPGVGVRLALGRAVTLLHASLGDAAALDSLLGRADPGLFSPGETAFLRSRQFAIERQGDAALDAYRVAASDSGPGLHPEWIRLDIQLIGAPGDVAHWDSLPVADRGAWITEFWAGRAFGAGKGRGDRLVEHVRRWQRAFADYRWYRHDDRLRQPVARERMDPSGPCGTEFTQDSMAAVVLGCALPPGEREAASEFDDRGRVYLRHGEPQRRANYPGIQHFTAESWLYVTEDGAQVIHFGGDVQSGMRASATAAGDWMTACQVSPGYCVLAGRRESGQKIPPERTRRVAEQGAAEMAALLSTDGAPQRFAEALAVNVGAYGLGRTASRLTLVADLPLEALGELADSGAGEVPLRWQIRVRATDGAWAVSRDTVERIALPAMASTGRGAYLTLIRDVPLAPGQYDLRLVLSDTAGRAGALYARDGIVVVGGAAGAAPGLSDVVLMPDGGQGGAWRIEGMAVHLSPTFTPGGAAYLRLGYLLTGLAGESVPVSVSVVRPGEAERAVVSVAFVDRPPTARAFREQRVGVAGLGRGGYDLVVRATLPDGSVAERRQRIVVR
jgi:hypothetical protein